MGGFNIRPALTSKGENAMSLENEIKKLTAAITELSAKMDGQELSQAVEGVAEKTTTEPKPEPKPEPKEGVTHDDVKSTILEKVQADKANKEKAKSILAEYDATKVADLHKDALAQVLEKVEAL